MNRMQIIAMQVAAGACVLALAAMCRGAEFCVINVAAGPDASTYPVSFTVRL